MHLCIFQWGFFSEKNYNNVEISKKLLTFKKYLTQLVNPVLLIFQGWKLDLRKD